MADDRGERRLQRLTAERLALRESATEALDALRATVEAQADPVITELDAQIQTVQHFLDLVKVLDTQLLDVVMDSEGDMTPEIQQTAVFQRPFVALIKRAEATLTLLARDGEPADAQSSTTQSFRSVAAPAVSHARLPKLELKPFSGDPIEWQSFWDSFEAKVDAEQSISQVDKLLYLLKLLKGEAEEATHGYRPTAQNYPVIVSVLKERFGNPETAKFKHFEALFELPSAEDEPSRLKDIYHECEKHIRCLVALGLREETFGQVFVPLILSKLPRATRLQLHRSNGQQDWTLDALRGLMKSEILARDLSNRFSKGGGASKTKQPPNGGGGGSPKGQIGHSHLSQKPKGGRQWSTQGSLVTTTKHKATQMQCAYCGGYHFADQCTKYTTVDSRRAALRNCCFRCLKSGHVVADCNSTKACFHCNATDHHTSLCYKQGKPQSSGGAQKGAQSGDKPPRGKDSGGPETSLSVDSSLSPGTQTVLKMAYVRFEEHNTSVRMYFDDGSTSSYLTTATAKRLKLRLSEYKYASVGRFGSNKRESKRFRTAELPIPLKDGSSFTVTVHVIDIITTPVQKVSLDPKRYPSLKILPLADSLCQRSEMVEIDVLIGGDYLHRLFTGERIAVDDGLFLYGSKLGYVAAGTVTAGSADNHQHTAVALHAVLEDANTDRARLEQMWALEGIGIKDDPHVSDDDVAQTKFDQSLRKVNGRFEVGLPFREDTVDLPGNYGLALGRLKSLQKRLDDSTAEQYDKTMVDQLQAGIIERVDPGAPARRVHYLPHHCVVKKDSATTKVRVVFDASAKARKADQSLNESLLRGPVVIADLCGFLLRARIPNIVLISDIEKAFHQISIRAEDRDSLRFLWLKRPWLPPTRDNLVTLRFCRVPFGMVCSPFLLNATIRHHLEQKGTPTAFDVKQNVYVDNILGGHQDVNAALDYYREAKECFTEISMNLREWHSNSSEFLEQIPEDDRGLSSKPKILGIPWDPQSDRLSCPGPTTTTECGTKRQFLSYMSSLFDPCGWISPIIVRAKLILQDLWKVNVGWDKPVGQETVDQMADFQSETREVEALALPRQVNACITHPKATHDLHIFVDASAKAYGAVSYVRSSTPGGKCSTGLLFSKVRLAPIKTLTIPRLELMAVVTGVRLMQFIVSELQPKLTFTRKFIWSDSKCVLFWLQSTKNLKVFVRNRLAEIKRKTTDVEFRYVPTAYNPADIPSRGATVDELKNSNLWWQGPSFLVLPPEMWPENIPEGAEPREAAQEVVSLPQHLVLIERSRVSSGLANLLDSSKYSSWKKLERVTAFVFLAVEKFKCRRHGQSGSDDPRPLLQSSHYRSARIALLRLAQDQIDPTSAAYKQLRLSEDPNGVLRCRTRMGNSALAEKAQAPILLPKDNHITGLIIQNGHEIMAHAGVRHTLVYIRSIFWVVQGKRQVQKTLHRCTACRKTGGGHYKAPEFAPLPSFRVNRTHAFAKVGIDYLGPLLVKTGTEGQYQKVWVALFTCCVTRAVHLDVVSNLSAEHFLLCFRRFVALYSKPTLIVSDNATQFKATSAAFISAARQWSDGEGIEWKFIVESAPWMGGFYERLVGSVKNALRKTLGSKRLNIHQLSTVLYEIAAIVNSRPLVPGGDVGQEPGELALTPGHFLPRAGRSGFQSLEGYLDSWESVPKPMSRTLLESWQRGQHILDEYWKSWHNDYLTSLREETQLGFRQRNCSHLEPQLGAVMQTVVDANIGVPADPGEGGPEVAQQPNAPTPQNAGPSPGGSNRGESSAARPKRRAAIHARDRNLAGMMSFESDDE